MADKAPAGRKDSIPLDQLLLDQSNPRFGGLAGKSVDQADILDHIALTFGLDDVLSSLAVNGYFDAEPMVCRKLDNGKYVVLEGNRRLSACLILTGDPRASRQEAKSKQYQAIWSAHGQKSLAPVPCIVFAEHEQTALLSYLGVRHISSAQPWDSYAKAAWVASIVEKSGLKLNDVALMIGDQHRTIARLLEGYYLIQQLVAEGAFTPSNSVRKGRGSVSEYPFSWVYTILGYQAVRRFLELEDTGDKKYPPLKPTSVPKAAIVVNSMFGDSSKGKDAAIEDSRNIGTLASAFSSPDKIAMLENGKSLKEIERQTQPVDERLRRGLADVREIHADLAAALSEGGVTADLALGALKPAGQNKAAAANIERQLKLIIMDGGDEADGDGGDVG